jgi:hypothetical protein
MNPGINFYVFYYALMFLLFRWDYFKKLINFDYLVMNSENGYGQQLLIFSRRVGKWPIQIWLTLLDMAIKAPSMAWQEAN